MAEFEEEEGEWLVAQVERGREVEEEAREAARVDAMGMVVVREAAVAVAVGAAAVARETVGWAEAVRVDVVRPEAVKEVAAASGARQSAPPEAGSAEVATVDPRTAVGAGDLRTAPAVAMEANRAVAAMVAVRMARAMAETAGVRVAAARAKVTGVAARAVARAAVARVVVRVVASPEAAATWALWAAMKEEAAAATDSHKGTSAPAPRPPRAGQRSQARAFRRRGSH